MRASNNGAQSPPSNTRTTTPSTTNAIINTHQHHNNNNNNNSSSSGSRSAAGSNTENSGSQYAMCALGVGLVALGIVMIVWSVVPADGGGDGGDGGRLDNRNKVSSVAFVLVGSGVVMLLLSLCLGVRNKQREQRGLRDAEAGRQAGRQAGAAGGPREDAETAEEHARRFAVPSYEEVVGSGQYPIRQSNHRQSTTQLPSYEDLVDRADGLQFENEVTDGVGVAGGDPASTTAAAAATPTEGVAPNRRAGKAARKLLNNKIRRIKSEKLHLKDVDGGQPPARFSIEPLTPPPQYEDKVPPI
ncbi:transmembrane protein 51a isoform X2 [Gadus macrocephalus]|nr:transmembrane protein 51a isoform X2 [Gadus macrocephalus]XP_059907576.1 transmembrane protein 51a isoform X2 [Gadus macrocephalus]